MYEINACAGGNGAMVKNWQETFENNIIADSSLGGAIWMGAYAGPVAQVIVRHNVFGNATGYCSLDNGNLNGIWPGEQNFVPPPGAPPGLGKPSGHILVNYPKPPFRNASMTCFQGSCNGWKPGQFYTYRLSKTEMALPMIQELDWNIVDQPLDKNMTIPPPLGFGFQVSGLI